MKNILFFLLSISFIISSCTKTNEICTGFDLVDSTIDIQDEYKIVETIIDSQLSAERDIHISQQTHASTNISDFSVYFDTEQAEFTEAEINDYASLNSETYFWGESFVADRNLISQEEIQCIFDSSANGWLAFNDKYPESRAYLHFGRPLIENNKATVVYTYLCGYTCSSGYTVTLEKKNEEWEVVDHIIIWIS